MDDALLAALIASVTVIGVTFVESELMSTPAEPSQSQAEPQSEAAQPGNDFPNDA